MLDFARIHPKVRSKIKFIAGDPYFEPMSMEEFEAKLVLKPVEGKKLRNFSDIDSWIEDNMNSMMPLDGP